MKKISFSSKFFYYINSVLAAILLLAYLLPFVSPKTIPTFAILSLTVPVLIIINILFLIYWLIKLKKQFFLPALVLAIGWLFSSPFYKFFAHQGSLNNDIKVMSYNVRMFNHYKWNEDETIAQKAFDFISKKDPDILVIQEFYEASGINFSYPYKFIKTKSETSKFGLAIYSKYAIVNSGSLDFKDSANNVIFIDIVKDNDTIRVYNVHLESLKVNPEKENFGEKDSGRLFKRLKNAFIKQAAQTEQFLEHEKQWKNKKIICGDFNSNAYSWVYKQISSGKKDAFIEAGKGFGRTFDYPFPIRIDFILTDESIDINQFKTFSVKYSDHFPIQARINW